MNGFILILLVLIAAAYAKRVDSINRRPGMLFTCTFAMLAIAFAAGMVRENFTQVKARAANADSVSAVLVHLNRLAQEHRADELAAKLDRLAANYRKVVFTRFQFEYTVMGVTNDWQTLPPREGIRIVDPDAPRKQLNMVTPLVEGSAAK